jgi:hypothetical protein
MVVTLIKKIGTNLPQKGNVSITSRAEQKPLLHWLNHKAEPNSEAWNPAQFRKKNRGSKIDGG